MAKDRTAYYEVLVYQTAEVSNASGEQVPVNLDLIQDEALLKLLSASSYYTWLVRFYDYKTSQVVLEEFGKAKNYAEALAAAQKFAAKKDSTFKVSEQEMAKQKAFPTYEDLIAAGAIRSN